MGSEFWAAVWGAIVGSGLGGAISAALQIAAQRRAAKDRRSDRLELDRARAQAVIIKVSLIADGFDRLARHIEQYTVDDWEQVSALANIPRPVDFAADDLIVLVSTGSGLFNRVTRMSEAFASAIDISTQYRGTRARITERLTPVNSAGDQIWFLESQRLAIAHLAAEANGNLSVLRKHCRPEYEACLALARDLAEVFDQRLGLTLAVEAQWATSTATQ